MKITLITGCKIFIAGSFFLFSCSTSSKIKSTGQLHADSSYSKNVDQIHTVTKDSTGYHLKDSSYKEIITIDFDTAELANDYEAAPLKKPRGPYEYNIGGNTVKTPIKVRSATIERNGHKSEIDAHQIKTADSTKEKTKEEAHVVIEEKKITKEKTSRHTPFAISLLLIIALVAAAWYALRRYKII